MWSNFTPAAILLLLAATTTIHAQTELTEFESPLPTDIAYQYFKLANYYISVNNDIARQIGTNCKENIQKIWNGINRYEQWSLQWPDSWGRLPVGVLWGHAKSYGSFQECLAAAHPRNELVKGKYCLASVPIGNFVARINSDTAQLRLSYKRKTPTTLELGICVPQQCKASETNLILKEVLRNQYDLTPSEYARIEMVNEKYCDYKKPFELRPVDILAICIFSVILFSIIFNTLYDYIKTQRNEPKRDLFVAFSLFTNAPKVFTVKKVNNPNVISCLSGMRVFSMMWVVYGHGYITYYTLAHVNFDKVYNYMQTPYGIILHNATFCVDTFFFMSGLLVIWGAFREMDKNKGRLNIPMMYFHRYVRLTPMVAVVILYIMSFYKYSGSGPMWMKIGTQDDRCAGTWWANFLYIQNYVYPYTFCMSQSWYLAVDTQLYVLSPLVLIPLYKWRKRAVPFVVVFLLLSIVCMFSVFMVNGFTTFRVDDDQYDNRQAKTYYPTHTRIPSWLLGVVFGYFLYTENRGKQFPLSKAWVLLGWALAFGTMICCMWGPYWRTVPGDPNPAPTIESSLYEALSRPSWNIAMAWVIWACYNGHGGFINDFLSWDFFTGFSRLSYSIYVVHRIVQYVNYGRVQTETTFDNYDFILRWWGDFGITVTVCCFLTLAFEVPILGIEKSIFNRSAKRPPAIIVVEEKSATAPIEDLNVDSVEHNNNKKPELV